MVSDFEISSRAVFTKHGTWMVLHLPQWSRGGGHRELNTDYQVLAPITLKMWGEDRTCNFSKFLKVILMHMKI